MPPYAQQTRYVNPMLVHRLRRWPSIGLTYPVCWVPSWRLFCYDNYKRKQQQRPLYPNNPDSGLHGFSQFHQDVGPGAVVKAACLECRWSRVRAPLWHSSFKKTICFFLAHSRRFNIVRSLRDREVAYSTSDRHGSNFEFCVWRTVSSHHPQEVLSAQFGLYVHKCGLGLINFYFIQFSRLDTSLDVDPMLGGRRGVCTWIPAAFVEK